MKQPIRLVLDTNVLVSAIFFSGVPYIILDAWRNGLVSFVVTREILAEYRETGDKMRLKFPAVDMDPWLSLLDQYAFIVDSIPLERQICADPDDDMFIACALVEGAKVICSGDKALLDTSGYCGIEVMKPRTFVDLYLK